MSTKNNIKLLAASNQIQYVSIVEKEHAIMILTPATYMLIFNELVECRTWPNLSIFPPCCWIVNQYVHH